MGGNPPPPGGVISGSVTVASNKFTDASGNANADGSDTNNAVSFTINLDVTPPTVIVSSPKSSLGAGETATVTFTLSEASVNFTAADVTVTGGTLSNFSGSGTSYTATFTPTAGASTASVKVDSNRFTDAAGNNNQDGAETNNTVSFNLDSTPPTIIVSSDKVDLLVGQTATITFTLSEASSNFTLSDISVTGGTLSNFQGSGTSYTATFTPTATGSSAMIVVSSNTFTDAAGNNNKDGADINNAVSLKTNCPPDTTPVTPPADTTAPTVAISSNKTMLEEGESATVSFTFSEATNDFALSDITVIGGTMSNLVRNPSNPLVYTATFTPFATTQGAMVLVSNDRFSDAAGNFNKDGADLNNAVSLGFNCTCSDTTAPTIAISAAKNSLAVGEVTTVTFVLSKDSTDFSLADITLLGGTLSNFVGSGKVYTATFTPAPTAKSAMLFVASDKFTDAAGNFNKDGADINNAWSFGLQCTPVAVAPAAPGAILNAISDSGTQGDNTTTDNTPTLSGTGTPGNTISIKDAAGNVIATAVVAANGTWMATPVNPLPVGLNNLSVIETNPAGMTSAPTALPLTIQSGVVPVAPTAPGAILNGISDSGTKGDNATNDTTPTLSGTGTPGNTIAIKDPAGNVIATAVVQPNGTWQATPSTPLPQGLNNLSVIETGPTGLTSPATPLPITIDSGSPTIVVSAPKGVLAAGEATTITFTLSDASSDFTLADITAIGGTLSGFTQSPSNPLVYTATFTPAAGARSALVFVSSDNFTDASGNLNQDGADQNNLASFSIHAAAVAPAAPAAKLDPVSDSGTLGDTSTNDATPTLSGTGTPGQTISILNAQGQVMATSTVQTNGTWSVTPATALPIGLNSLSVTATDAAGNTSAPTPLPITIETAATAAPLVIQGGVYAGPFSGGTDVLVYDNSGTLMGAGTVGADGSWKVTVSDRNEYRGTVLIKGVDANGAAVNYLDEVSATGKSLDTTLRAMGVAEEGWGNFSVASDMTATLTINITPVTELAVRIAGIADTATAPLSSSTAVAAANAVVAKALGIPGVDITAKPTTTNSPEFTATERYDADGVVILTAAEKYGLVLTKLSGLDSITGNVDASLDALQTQVQAGGALSASGSSLLEQGRAAALTALKSTTNGPEKTFELDTPFNRWLLGDVVITNQVLNGNNVALTGAALPGSIVTATLTDGSQTTANANAKGGFGMTLPASSMKADSLVKFTASDGLVQPASIEHNLPQAPVAAPDMTALTDTGTSSADNLTFNSTPSFVLLQPLPLGIVDVVLYADGQAVASSYNPTTGTLTPVTPLANGQQSISLAYKDARGNVSPQGPILPITIDTLAPAAPAAVLDPSSDSGIQGDKTTTDTTPTLSGNATPGDTITIKDPQSNVIGTAVVAANGTWAITPATALPEGQTNLAVTATDPTGNVSAPTALPITIDTLAPVAPAAIIEPTSDSGSKGDLVTTDKTPTLSGTGTPGDTITIKNPQGAVIGTATVAANGSWAFTPTTALPEGTNALSVTATDPSGNVSAPTALPITIDTLAPVAPAAILDPSSDSGTQGDKTTTDTTPTLSGTGVPGNVITIKDAAGNTLATAVVQPNGSWAATPTTAMPAGINALTMTATDPAGNTSAPTALAITIDTTPPAAPAAVLDPTSDSGTQGDKTTTDTTPTLSGTGSAGDTITLKNAAGNTIATAVVAPNGTWAATPTTALPEGLNALSVTATDPAGNVSAPTALPITIDTTPPAAPAAVLDPTSDSGAKGDRLTTDTTPTLSGNGTPGDTITIKNPQGVVIGTTTVNPDGSWDITPTTALPEAQTNLAVTATDPSGNISAPTALPITIDTTAPATTGAQALTAALVPTSDSGILGDSMTNDTTPTLGGQGTPGDTITLNHAAGTLIGTATVQADGSWRITPTTPLPEGTHNFNVTATDPAGNSISQPLSVTVVVDALAPAAPSAKLDPVSDSGTQGDQLTNDTTPTLSGTGTPGQTISILNAQGQVMATSTVQTNGTWSATPATALPIGLNSLSVTATDTAGNTSAPTPLPITIETASTAPPLVIQGGVYAGPFSGGTDVLVYDNSGALMGAGTVGADGSWKVTVSNRNEYRGTVLIKGVDANGAAVNYLDEVSATSKSLDTTLRAMGVAEEGWGNFSVASDMTATLTINITPVTELAVRIAGIADTATAPLSSSTAVAAVNAVVAKALGIPGVDITAKPTTTNSAEFTATERYDADGVVILTAAEKYGLVLTKLSGLDSITGNVDASLDALQTQVQAGGALSASGSSLLEQGRAAALAALKSTTNGPEKTFELDTPFNRWLLGDVVITNQELNGNNVALTGSALPGSIVTATLTDGTQTKANANAKGGFGMTLPASSMKADSLVKFTASDGLVQPASIEHNLPQAPVAAPDMTALTDTGTSSSDNRTFNSTPSFVLLQPLPLGIVDVVLYAGGQPVASSYNPTTGTLTPVTPLANGQQSISLAYKDARGNVSPQGPSLPITIDTLAPAAPAAILDPSSDSGTQGDKTTTDTTPTLSGNATPGDTITIKDPQSKVIGTAVVAANGTWAITPTTALPDGTIALSVTATEPSGNTSAAATLPITIDTTPPAAPAAVLEPTSDSGSKGDRVTTDTTPTLSGAGGTPGDTITIKNPQGAVIGTAVVAANGSWAITPTTALPEGTNALSVTATDPSGNISAPTALPITIDTLAPVAPAAILDPTSDSGTQGDKITIDSTPTLSGTGVPGNVITIKDAAGNTIATAVVQPNGSWAATPTTAMPAGINALTMTATDPAGNTSAPTALAITIDTTPPAAPAAVLDPTSDSGSKGDRVTTDATPTLSGNGTPGDTITAKDPQDNVIATAVVAPNGSWAATPTTALPEGLNALSVTATDPAGNISTPTALPITIDTTPSAAPAAVLDPTSDSGTQGDKITTDTTPTLSGAGGTPGDTITIKDPQSNVIGTAVVAANGSWAITPTTALPDGTIALSVTATDPSGNVSAPTALPITIDTTPAAAPAAVLDPTSDSGTQGDKTTTDTTPTLSGTGVPGNVITIKDDVGNTIATAVVQPNGSWAATPTTALPAGITALTMTATDPAGNTSAPTALAITIDTTPPAAPAAILDPTSDSGTQGDKTTTDATPTLSGNGTPGDTITVKDPQGNVIATAVVAPNGTWAATPTTALPEGLNALSVTATDPAGNISAPTALPITIDTTPPAAPAAVLDTTSDSGNQGDKTTTDTTPTLSGAGGTPGDTITIKDPQSNVIGTATVAANGTWAITPTTALPDGTIALSVTATDPSGNTSAPTALPITIDTAPPAAPAAVLDPTSDSGTQGDKTTTDTTPTLSGAGATPGDTITVKDPQSNVIGTAVVAANGSWAITPTTALPLGLNNLSVTATDPAGNISTPTALPVTIEAVATAPAAPAAVLDPSSDSGKLLDSATNDNMPTLSGTGTAGDTISVKDPQGNVIATAVVAANGTWLATPTNALPEGLINLSVIETNPAGLSSAPTSLPITIDTTPPAAPAAVLDPTSDSGIKGDRITTDATPTLSGNGTPGDTITVKDPQGNVIATAVVAPNGSWAATPTTALPEGLNALSVTATDPAGNVSAPTALPITIDTTPPAAPAAVLDPTSDSGTQGDKTTTDTTPTLSGAGGTPGDTITIKDPQSNVIGTATVAANGTWAITPTTALPLGLNNLSVTATDPAGNISTPTALPVTIEAAATAPAAPAAVLDPTSDSGKLLDSATNDNTPTLSGTGTAGDTISVKDPQGNVIATAVVAANGTWLATLTAALPEGLINLSVIETNPAGLSSAPTALPITIDTTPPAAPAAVLDPTSDSGIQGDKTTTDTTPTLSGAGATPGDTITIKDPQSNVIGTATVAINGTWAITPTTALPDGTIALSVTATDPAGNISTPTALPITIDTTPPAAPAAVLDPTSDSGTQGDKTTTDTTPTLSGAGATPGDTITVKDPQSNVIGTAVVAANGTWAITPTTALPLGLNNLSVTATDPAGNISTPTALPVTIEAAATAPAAPAAVLDPTSDSGTQGDSSTTDTTPTLSGAGATPGGTITIKDPQNNVIGTAVVAANGSWSVTPTTPLPAGANNLSVTQTSPQGLTSTATALPITIEANTATFSSMTKDSGVTTTPNINSNWLTNDTSAGRLVSGFLSSPLAAGEVVNVYANGTLIGTATVATGGTTWAITDLSAYGTNASWTYTAKVVDASNTAGPVAEQIVNTDLTQAKPVITGVFDTVNSSTTIANGASTANVLSTVKGTAAAGETIYLYDNTGANLVGSATVGANGLWSITGLASNSALGAGSNTFAAVQTDVNGNISALSNLWTVSAPTANGIANGRFETGDLTGFSTTLGKAGFVWDTDGGGVASVGNYNIVTFIGTPVSPGIDLNQLNGGTWSQGTWSEKTNYVAAGATGYETRNKWGVMANGGKFFFASLDYWGDPLVHSPTFKKPFLQSNLSVEAGKTYTVSFDYFNTVFDDLGTSTPANRTGMDVLIGGQKVMTTIARSLGTVTIEYTATTTGTVPLELAAYTDYANADLALGNFSFMPAVPTPDGSLVDGQFLYATPNPDSLNYTKGVLDALASNDTITAISTNLQATLTAGGLISGGAGVDTLQLAAGTTLDLTAITQTQTVKPIQQVEVIEMQGNSLLTLSANNVLSLGGSNATTMAPYTFASTSQTASNSGVQATGTTSSTNKVQFVVNGTHTDSVLLEALNTDGLVNANAVEGNTGLAGQWLYKGSTSLTVNGVTQSYRVYDHSTTQAQILVDADVNTSTDSNVATITHVNASGTTTKVLTETFDNLPYTLRSMDSFTTNNGLTFLQDIKAPSFTIGADGTGAGNTGRALILNNTELPGTGTHQWSVQGPTGITQVSANYWDLATGGTPAQIIKNASPSASTTMASGGTQAAPSTVTTSTASVGLNSVGYAGQPNDKYFLDNLQVRVEGLAETTQLAHGSATRFTTGTVNGTLATPLLAGQYVQVFSNGVSLGNASVNGSSWSINDTTITTGGDSYTAQVKNADGSAVTASNRFELNAVSGSTPKLTLSDDTVVTVATGVSVNYTFQFDQAVTGFDASDVVVTGGGVKGPLIQLDNKTWVMSINTPNLGAGNMTVAVADGNFTATTGGASGMGASSSQAYDASLTKYTLDGWGVAGATVGSTPAPLVTGPADDIIYAVGQSTNGVESVNLGAGDDDLRIFASNVTKLALATGNASFDGGTGVDILELFGTGMTLDLTNVNVGNNLKNFESIDITGTGNNIVKLNLNSVLNMSDIADNLATTANEGSMMVLNGNAGDTVQLVGGINWTTVTSGVSGASLATTYGTDYAFAAADTYREMSYNGATLFIDEAMTRTNL
ncbi:Ig-like domain-containing protein [Limnohabitans planktonicus]|uniref:Ig-like domain-containing protein n=1 Tax=Limnohabitans planktonicus TaxID=540060 RepID=UPI00197B8610|nr:Ig-like domain-containing protein [Limnohabitans planktonicus]